MCHQALKKRVAPSLLKATRGSYKTIHHHLFLVTAFFPFDVAAQTVPDS